MYVNGLGFRAIERVTGVNHNTVINWVKQLGNTLTDVPEYQSIKLPLFFLFLIHLLFVQYLLINIGTECRVINR
jgi:hypothetical protein